MLALCLFALLLPQQGPTVPGRTGAVGGGGGGSPAPTVTGTPGVDFGFSTPQTTSLGTLNSGDIVNYFVITNSNTQTFTMSVTGTCASTGGNVTDTGPTGQGAAASSTQTGHIVLTTGGSCSLSTGWTGAGSMNVAFLVVRGSSGVDVTSTLNNQNGPGTGTNAITSPSVTTTGTNRLCVGGSTDANISGGTLTAGTSPIAWTLGAEAQYHTGNEYAVVSGAGSVTATFTYSNNSFLQTAVTCYKP